MFFSKRFLIILIFLIFTAEGIYYYYYYHYSGTAESIIPDNSLQTSDIKDIFNKQFDATVRFKNITILYEADNNNIIYTAQLSRSDKNNMIETWSYINGWKKFSDDFEKTNNAEKVYHVYFGINDIYWDKLPLLMDTSSEIVKNTGAENLYVKSILIYYTEYDKSQYDPNILDTLTVTSAAEIRRAEGIRTNRSNWNMVISYGIKGSSTSFNYVFDQVGNLLSAD